IAEVDAQTLPAGSGTLDGAELDLDPVCLEVLGRLGSRSRPGKAETGFARGAATAGDGLGRRAGPVHVQLLLPEPERDARAVELDHLRAPHVAIERRRPLPVGAR